MRCFAVGGVLDGMEGRCIWVSTDRPKRGFLGVLGCFVWFLGRWGGVASWGVVLFLFNLSPTYMVESHLEVALVLSVFFVLVFLFLDLFLLHLASLPCLLCWRLDGIL